MRFLFSILMLSVIAWSLAVVWFVNAMPRDLLPPTEKADAIIVLTGGQDRVEHGFAMLGEGAAPVLLISGVGEHVTEEEILNEHATDEIRNHIYEHGGEIVLDHIARSTVSNADQSAAFIRDRHIKRIRLVTANYHMKRSVHEFRMASPEVVILPDPVFPAEFRREQWWAHGNTRRLVFSEFYKYFAVLLRDVLRPTEDRVSTAGTT